MTDWGRVGAALVVLGLVWSVILAFWAEGMFYFVGLAAASVGVLLTAAAEDEEEAGGE